MCVLFAKFRKRVVMKPVYQVCKAAKKVAFGEAVERLSVLVINILLVNRLENQNIQPVLQPSNISEALCRCILNYDSLLDKKNITLDTELDQNIILTSNEELLDLVWNNLFSNAIKFTQDNGHIQIKLRQDKE